MFWTSGGDHCLRITSVTTLRGFFTYWLLLETVFASLYNVITDGEYNVITDDEEMKNYETISSFTTHTVTECVIKCVDDPVCRVPGIIDAVDEKKQCFLLKALLKTDDEGLANNNDKINVSANNNSMKSKPEQTEKKKKVKKFETLDVVTLIEQVGEEILFDTQLTTMKKVEPVHGNWGAWTVSIPCPVTCGPSHFQVRRACTCPAPSNGGLNCTRTNMTTGVEERMTRGCNYGPCPINGGYSSWSTYGVCSKTCETGEHFRTRTCNHPIPQHGGKNCSQIGQDKETKNCNKQACPRKWYLQKSNLCFGIKSSEYDVFRASHSGSLCKLRFEHVSGKVWCSGSDSSFWGCPYFSNNRVMVIITDKRNNVIYPKVSLHKSNGWGYIASGYTEYSKNIKLDFQNGGHYDVTEGKELRVWHAEDLYNGNESNNHGKTCAKVYAMFNC